MKVAVEDQFLLRSYTKVMMMMMMMGRQPSMDTSTDHLYPISSTSAAENSLPGIILFHTGAGPQDIFLRWKADSLVNEADDTFEDGCVQWYS